MRNLTDVEKRNLPLLPLSIPEFPSNGGQRTSHPFSSGERIQLYRPTELAKRSGEKLQRTDWFEKRLVAIHEAIGGPVPYAFRTANEEIRSLDAGCLGFLANSSSPAILFQLDGDGHILAVTPTAALVATYRPMLSRILLELNVQTTHVPQQELVVDRESLPLSAGPNVTNAQSTAMGREPMQGDKLYQQRARDALPILVGQAETRRPITYSSLAEELRMRNVRNLNYVLESVGQTLNALSQEWGTPIPHLNSLVVNKATGRPGDGVLPFLTNEGSLSPLRRNELIELEHARVFAYPRWRDVLVSLRLPMPRVDFAEANRAASSLTFRSGESEDHKRLKAYVAATPSIVRLPSGTLAGETECTLPSGDALDVSFRTKAEWLGVEVKSAISDIADITRGLYQCVKYAAVMQAVERVEGRTGAARAVLVLEAHLPASLVALRNRLGVEVFENVRPIV